MFRRNLEHKATLDELKIDATSDRDALFRRPSFCPTERGGRLSMAPMQRHRGRRTASDLPGLDIAERKSWHSYLDAAIRFDAAMNRQLTEQHQLSVLDFRVLDTLTKADDGALQMGDLAVQVESMPARLTKRVHGLEERGLVCRQTSPEDGRKVMAVITEAGSALAERASDTYAAVVRTHFVDPLTRTQIKTIDENCQRIIAGLKAPDFSPRPGS